MADFDKEDKSLETCSDGCSKVQTEWWTKNFNSVQEWRDGTNSVDDAAIANMHGSLLSESDLNPSVDPLFRFGVIADVQYADLDPGYNYPRTKKRTYRHSLCALNQAVLDWNAVPGGLSFIAQLGDLIDGLNRANDNTDDAMTRVYNAFQRCTATRDIHHLIGNHELYNFPREHLFDAPHQLYDGTYSYHSFVPHPGWRFIALDPFDVGVLGWSDDHPKRLEAHGLLSSKNPNWNSKGDWRKGLEGLAMRYVSYNGAVSLEQLKWLRSELDLAVEKSELVVVMSHVPLHPSCCPPDGLVWNFDEVLSCLYEKGKGHVVAALYGHEHSGGYGFDESGIHHVVLPSPLETPPPLAAHATVEVFNEAVVIRGRGAVPTRILRVFGPKQQPDAKMVCEKHRHMISQQVANEHNVPIEQVHEVASDHYGNKASLRTWVASNVGQNVHVEDSKSNITV